MPAKSEKPITVQNALHSFMETSTVIGVNRILSSPFRAQRLLWTVFVIGGTIATGYHAYTMIDRYFSYPSKTSYKIDASEDALLFPAVSICNLNAISRQKYCNVRGKEFYCGIDDFIRFDAFEASHFRKKVLTLVTAKGFNLSTAFPTEHPTEFLATKLFSSRNMTYFNFTTVNVTRNLYLWQAVLDMELRGKLYDNLSNQSDAEVQAYIAKSGDLSSVWRQDTPLNFWDTANFAQWPLADYDKFVLNCIFDRRSCAHVDLNMISDVDSRYGQCFTMGSTFKQSWFANQTFAFVNYTWKNPYGGFMSNTSSFDQFQRANLRNYFRGKLAKLVPRTDCG